jgi:ERCC4-related helicase
LYQNQTHKPDIMTRNSPSIGVQKKIEKAALTAAPETSASDFKMNTDNVERNVLDALPMMVSYHDVMTFVEEQGHETLFDYLQDAELTEAMKAIAYSEN